MAPQPPDTTTVQPTETEQGVPDASDRVVRELDVFLVNELGTGAQTYLLQFPLRPPWRPYHSEDAPLQNVKLKPKVKKLEAEVPLDAASRNYNQNAEDSRKIKAAVLQSARLDMRTSFAAGFVEGDRLVLFPVDEALQLRPSLAHLDKEKEAAGGGGRKKKGGEADADAEAEAKQPELMQLTVQVKRRETEQQAEARLRSYAHLAAQEEADAWVPLEFHTEDSALAHKIWTQLAAAQAPDVPLTLSREQYLAAIVPGPSQLQEGGATWAAGQMAAQDLGRPAAAAAGARGGSGAAQPGGGGMSIPDEALPAIVETTLKLLKTIPVANLEAIRNLLARHSDAAIKQLAAGAPDAALHAAVVADGRVTHLRKSYFATRLGNATLDPLRNVLIELLTEKESLKRSEIVEAARAKGITVSDSLYSKVVKELCTSRGAMWSLK